MFYISLNFATAPAIPDCNGGKYENIKKIKRIIGIIILAITVLPVPGASLPGQTVYAAEADSLTITDMPEYLRDSIEWVWNNRILAENSTARKNLIFDQIFAGKGTINYVVRWQSDRTVALLQRKDMEAMPYMETGRNGGRNGFNTISTGFIPFIRQISTGSGIFRELMSHSLIKSSTGTEIHGWTLSRHPVSEPQPTNITPLFSLLYTPMESGLK